MAGHTSDTSEEVLLRQGKLGNLTNGGEHNGLELGVQLLQEGGSRLILLDNGKKRISSWKGCGGRKNVQRISDFIKMVECKGIGVHREKSQISREDIRSRGEKQIREVKLT